MAEPDVKFTKEELRGVMKFFFLQQKSPKEIHGCMLDTLGGQCPSYSTVKKWCANFKRGDFSSDNGERCGRPVSVSTPEKVDQVHDLILSNRRISLQEIADIVHISKERVGSIIHDQLDMRKLSAKWIPKCLNVDEKRKRVTSSQVILRYFATAKDDFVNRLVTQDETWLHCFDPETKQQSCEWRHSGSPRPKKFKAQKSAGKVLASIFWDEDGVLLSDYLPKGQTITAEYYCSLLAKLKDAIKEKSRGKLRRGVLFLQDNAPVHTAGKTMDCLRDQGFQCIDHPPYSPDLAPSNYFLFPKLKMFLK